MAKGIDELRNALKAACKRRGASAFGVASVEDADALERIRIQETGFIRWSEKIRDHLPNATTVVVFGVKSTDDADELAIHRGGNNWVYPAYFPLTHMRRDVLQILRENGYKAIPLPALVPIKRIAILAGFGAYGKNSMVLSPRHGLWLRLEAVVTDAGLPIDRPINRDLCGSCIRCVRACPAKALKPYILDPSRCLVDMSLMKNPPKQFDKLRHRFEPQLTPNTHVMCTMCQKACPYTTKERRSNSIPLTPASRRRPGRA
jgi:ferredoxin